MMVMLMTLGRSSFLTRYVEGFHFCVFADRSTHFLKLLLFAHNHSLVATQLHRLLDDAEQETFDDIIAWSPSGTSFRVFSKERFEDEVMGVYFESTKYKSFQRTLNLWGFQVRDNKKIANENFVRGEVQLCALMKRIKVKGAYQRRHKNPAGTCDSVKQASPTAPLNMGKSMHSKRLCKGPSSITSEEGICPPRHEGRKEVGLFSCSNMVNASSSRSPRSLVCDDTFETGGDKRTLLSLMLDGANNRYPRGVLSCSPHPQLLLTTAFAIMHRTGRAHSFDPQHRLPNAFEDIAMLSNKPRMFPQETFPARSEAFHHALHNMKLHRSSSMPTTQSAALTIQNTIDQVCRQRLMAAYEEAAACALLRMTPQDSS
jgi:hypothetical protein